MSVISTLHEYLFHYSVSFGGSWGGLECYNTVDIKTHVLETIFWLCISYGLYKYVDFNSSLKRLLKSCEQTVSKSKTSRNFEIFLGMFELLMWCQTFYIRFQKKALITLLQPCYVILFLQSLSFLLPGKANSLIPALIIQMVFISADAIL